MLIKNIENLIPQRPPFIMVDQLVFADDTKAESSFIITGENILTETNQFSEAGIIENIAQSAALHTGYLASQTGNTSPWGIIGRIKNLKINFLPKTGDEINTVITIENEVMNAKIIKGIVYHKKEIIAECEMTIFLT